VLFHTERFRPRQDSVQTQRKNVDIAPCRHINSMVRRAWRSLRGAAGTARAAHCRSSDGRPRAAECVRNAERSRIVGLGKAARIAREEVQKNPQSFSDFARNFAPHSTGTGQVYINGDLLKDCGNLNMSFAYVEGESLLMESRHWVSPAQPAHRQVSSLRMC